MSWLRSGFGSWLGRWCFRAVLVAVTLTVAVVLLLRWIAPPTSAVMLEARVRKATHMEVRPGIRYRWADWHAISPAMRLAVVAAEDQKFPQHWGFDLDSIADAVQTTDARGRLRGASTITQQVARNLFLWQGRSYLRKGLEAYVTALLELLWTKRRILEVYLNIAEFGEGTYGVAAASHAYFGKRPGDLNAQEAALLAAVLPNPVRFHVRNPSMYVRDRAGWIETQMAHLGPAYLRSL